MSHWQCIRRDDGRVLKHCCTVCGVYVMSMQELFDKLMRLSSRARDDYRSLTASVTQSTDERLLSQRPSDHQPSDHQPPDHQPQDNQPSDHQPSDNQPSYHQPSDHQPSDNEPSDHQPQDNQPSDNQPPDHQPSDHQPSDHQPSDNQPSDNHVSSSEIQHQPQITASCVCQRNNFSLHTSSTNCSVQTVNHQDFVDNSVCVVWLNKVLS